MLHVMADMTRLEALIRRLADDRALMQRGEPGTRMGAINPTLRALGWDTDNLNEVDPEFEDGSGGKVDYCLRHQGRNLVLIEAKRASADLAPHQEQLLQYAFGLGTRMAALTNGLDWWLYLPMKGDRPFEERRFARVDFREQAPDEAASALSRFLNRDEVVSGVTLKEAEAEFERQERDEEVRSAFPSVWRRLVTDPTDSHGEMLHELLIEAVRSEVGHRPAREAVHQYLLDTLGPERAPAASSATRTAAASARRSRKPRQTASQSASATTEPPRRPSVEPTRTDFTGKQPVAFWLGGDRYEVTRWKTLLQGVCGVLAAQSGEHFGEQVRGLRGTKRIYFSTSRDDLVEPLAIANSDFFVESHFSANDCVRRAREALIAVRGSDDGFRIELAE